MSNSGWSWPTGAPASTARELIGRGLRGAALDRALAHDTTRHLALATMTEQLPSADNRIVPDYDHRDALGLPRPRIAFRLDEYTRRGLEHARRLHDRVFAAVDATEIHHGDDVKPAGHLLGTCRMGTDPRSSVVDADQRAHDHRNLFILGSSVFPTGAASNPTLTIAAMSLRSVQAIRRAVKG